MPTRPVSATAISVATTGGSSGLISGGFVTATAVVLTVDPIQLLGFVPMVDCSFNECREFFGKCYNNPVFGTININSSTYENDVSNFFFDDSMKRVAIFVLQKLDQQLLVWNDQATIGSSFPALFPSVSTYGTFYNYTTFSTHTTYFGIQINWGHVLALKGSGIYRLKLYSPNMIPGGSLIDPNPYNNKPNPFPYCMVSEPFDLKPFNCNIAKRTVKFEVNQSGMIGSITTDGYVFDLCNMIMYDSIRVKGFFGFEKTQYDEILLEYETGLIDRVRDEAVQKFEFIMHPSPKYIHDRFKTYGLMADNTYVSDYNLNNSDYDIKKKSVIKAGGYEPKYYTGNRLSSVKVEFKEGIQGVIKSSSCDAR